MIEISLSTRAPRMEMGNHLFPHWSENLMNNVPKVIEEESGTSTKVALLYPSSISACIFYQISQSCLIIIPAGLTKPPKNFKSEQFFLHNFNWNFSFFLLFVTKIKKDDVTFIYLSTFKLLIVQFFGKKRGSKKSQSEMIKSMGNKSEPIKFDNTYFFIFTLRLPGSILKLPLKFKFGQLTAFPHPRLGQEILCLHCTGKIRFHYSWVVWWRKPNSVPPLLCQSPTNPSMNYMFYWSWMIWRRNYLPRFLNRADTLCIVHGSREEKKSSFSVGLPLLRTNKKSRKGASLPFPSLNSDSDFFGRNGIRKRWHSNYLLLPALNSFLSVAGLSSNMRSANILENIILISGQHFWSYNKNENMGFNMRPTLFGSANHYILRWYGGIFFINFFGGQRIQWPSLFFLKKISIGFVKYDKSTIRNQADEKLVLKMVDFWKPSMRIFNKIPLLGILIFFTCISMDLVIFDIYPLIGGIKYPQIHLSNAFPKKFSSNCKGFQNQKKLNICSQTWIPQPNNSLQPNHESTIISTQAGPQSSNYLIMMFDSETPGDHFWHFHGKCHCRGVPLKMGSVLEVIGDNSLNIIISSPVTFSNGRYISTKHKELIKKKDYRAMKISNHQGTIYGTSKCHKSSETNLMYVWMHCTIHVYFNLDYDDQLKFKWKDITKLKLTPRNFLFQFSELIRKIFSPCGNDLNSFLKKTIIKMHLFLIQNIQKVIQSVKKFVKDNSWCIVFTKDKQGIAFPELNCSSTKQFQIQMYDYPMTLHIEIGESMLLYLISTRLGGRQNSTIDVNYPEFLKVKSHSDLSPTNVLALSKSLPKVGMVKKHNSKLVEFIISNRKSIFQVVKEMNEFKQGRFSGKKS
ncbi:hypothetical protein VP01_1093g1 [Puccinia sorghi]|uniref:Uncharacterized protein n=1 Tax=Puccinia sorghi TaxID=27349 RepID=A0A0L6VTB8_9BASI|nr:hypothetical protein VP01_1093g1 [Puccinia sorghi]